MEQSPFPSTTFILSEKFVRRSQRVLQFLTLAVPAVMGMVFLLTPIYFSTTTPACLGILLVLGLVGFGIATVWDPPNVKQRLASQRVTLNDTALQLYHQGSTQTMRYEEMRQVKIGVDKAGEIQSIQIHSGDDVCTLLGFGGMAQIAERLQAYVPDSAIVQRQPVWPNRSVWYHVAGFIALLVLGIALLIQLTEGAITEFTGWLFLIMGVYTLWRRPYSGRDGKQKRSVALFIGGMYVFLGVLSLNADLQNAGGAAAIWRNPCGLIGKVVQRSGCISTVPSENDLFFAANNRSVLWRENERVYLTHHAAWLGFWTPTLAYEDVDQLLVSADGGTAVVLADDRTVLDVWDITTRTRRQHLTLPADNDFYGERVQVSPDGHYLANVDEEAGLTLWDLATGQPVMQVATEVFTVAFAPDGQYVAGADENQITIWRTTDGTEWQTLALPEDVAINRTQPRFSPDGQWLMVAGQDSASHRHLVIALWQLPSGNLHHVLTLAEVDYDYQVLFSPDNKFVVSVAVEVFRDEEGMQLIDRDQTQLVIWRLDDGVLVKKQWLRGGYRFAPLSLDFSPDGSLLAVGLDEVGMVFRTEQLFSGLTVQD